MLVACGLCLHAQADDSAGAASTSLTFSPRTRALVIAPHPDDAVLGAGGLIRRVAARGGSVEIVEMTSGDAFGSGVAAFWPTVVPNPGVYRSYGALRERETVRAMRELGIGRSRIRLLGFPDDGLCQLAANSSARTIFTSPYTGREGPPSTERMIPGTRYRGVDLEHELERILLAFRPTVIVVPHPRDEHPDHCATHVLAHRAIDALEAAEGGGLRRPRVLHYLIHYRVWPGDAWEALKLTTAERAAKRRAIEAFRTQTTVMADFMHEFDRPDEPFLTGEPETDAPCWCRGENILRRGSPGGSERGSPGSPGSSK
jgi:LmbE family N-acetylglucosaminyl deacetylase